MLRVLILGGTRFFGKILASRLIEAGHSVTIATRGRTQNVHEGAHSVVADRGDPKQLLAALGNSHYDVVYDQIGYSPNDAATSVHVFGGRVSKYIFTSSMAVYGYSEDPWTESGFNPFEYPVRSGDRADFNYAEGKRLAEAVLFQHAEFHVTAVRIPVVLGVEDYTQRVQFHIERIRAGIPIGFSNLDAKTSLIHADEAAKFLEWVGISKGVEGPVNACSEGHTTWKALISTIEQVVGQKESITTRVPHENWSPYNETASRFMNTHKATNAGFGFTRLDDWFSDLIQQLTS